MVNNYVKAVRYYDTGRVAFSDVFTFDDRDADSCAEARGFANGADGRVSVWRPFAGLPVIGDGFFTEVVS